MAGPISVTVSKPLYDLVRAPLTEPKATASPAETAAVELVDELGNLIVDELGNYIVGQ